jgi:secreted PhoX family phosphatase
VPGGTGETPLQLPPGFTQQVLAREGDGGAGDQWDMNVLNETGPHAGRFLYRTHEQRTLAHVSVTDLKTGITSVLTRRTDWNRLDGLAWTKWQTLLVAEEMRPERTPSTPDPDVPQAIAGLVYEIDPVSGDAVARPAIGARAHEGLRFDRKGNLYGISETLETYFTGPRERHGGFIYKFTPDRRGDLSSGQLYALRLLNPAGDEPTGPAVWVALDRETVQVDSDSAAFAAGATGFARPEDVEIGTSTGRDREGPHILYVAVTDEHRVLRIDLEPSHRHGHDDDDDADDFDDGIVLVSEYVKQGVNAPGDFEAPDNLALDRDGNLYISEDAADPVLKGNDVWTAIPSGESPERAARTVRFATLTDCGAEPSGLYFDKSGRSLFVNILHRGGQDANGVSALPDLGMAVFRQKQD